MSREKKKEEEKLKNARILERGVLNKRTAQTKPVSFTKYKINNVTQFERNVQILHKRNCNFRAPPPSHAFTLLSALRP